MLEKLLATHQLVIHLRETLFRYTIEEPYLPPTTENSVDKAIVKGILEQNMSRAKRESLNCELKRDKLFRNLVPAPIT